MNTKVNKNGLLIVDDNDLNRDILKVFFEEKYNVFEACDGLEGLKTLEHNHDLIQIVLLDWFMPKCDGSEFMRRKMKNARIKDIPVIGITSSTEKGAVGLIDLGADDVIWRDSKLVLLEAKIRKIIKEREGKYTELSIEGWLEKDLPYPLASILRRYVTETNIEKKENILFYFFESFSILYSCIMLSFFHEYKNRENLEQLKLINFSQREFFEKATFGNWGFLIGEIIKRMADAVHNSNNHELISEIFGVSDIDFLLVFCDSRIARIINETVTYRNNWKGHSGITNHDICKNHIEIMEHNLERIHIFCREVFAKYLLIKPCGLRYSDGVFTNDVEILMGSNGIFMRKEIQSQVPLDEKYIYLWTDESKRCVKMIPLVKIEQVEEGVNACYFYNRLKDGAKNTKYVTYHYAPEPELIVYGREAYDALCCVI